VLCNNCTDSDKHTNEVKPINLLKLHTTCSQDEWINRCPGDLAELLLQLARELIKTFKIPCHNCKVPTELDCMRVGVNWFHEFQFVCKPCWHQKPDVQVEPDYVVPEWPQHNDCIKNIKQSAINVAKLQHDEEMMYKHFQG
jgi:hypothetical protein